MTAEVARVIPASPEEVWKTLTSKEGMKAYMMGADVRTDWSVGGPICMTGEVNGKRFEDRGEVRSFEPGRKLSYTHVSSAAPEAEHLVTFELRPADGGTQVKVTQGHAKGGRSGADDDHKAKYEKTWATMLERLEQAVLN